MNHISHTKGYSLVEVMVAVTILMISIIGPITIAAKSLQSAQYARQQNTAFFLAQEGITIANTLRNDSALEAYQDGNDPWGWTVEPTLGACFDPEGCNIDFSDETLLDNVADCSSSATACTLFFDDTRGRAAYQLISGAPSPYTRVITFEFMQPDEILVQSTVSWGSTLLGGEQTITLSTSLFNIFK